MLESILMLLIGIIIGLVVGWTVRTTTLPACVQDELYDYEEYIKKERKIRK